MLLLHYSPPKKISLRTIFPLPRNPNRIQTIFKYRKLIYFVVAHFVFNVYRVGITWREDSTSDYALWKNPEPTPWMKDTPGDPSFRLADSTGDSWRSVGEGTGNCVGCHTAAIAKYFFSDFLQFFVPIFCGTWWTRRKKGLTRVLIINVRYVGTCPPYWISHVPSKRIFSKTLKVETAHV